MPKDTYYMQLALSAAQASKCLRAKFGCVIVGISGRVISTAYNGKPMDSTNDSICYRQDLQQGAQKENCCLHAEANAILFSAPDEREGGTLYVTGIPCADCCLLIMQAGIRRLVHLDDPSTGEYNGGRAFLHKYGSRVMVDIMTQADLEGI